MGQTTWSFRLLTLILPILSSNALILKNDHFARTHNHSHHHQLAEKHKRALPVGWTSQGCWSDAPVRTLNALGYASGDAMSPDACVGFCNSKGYIYAGVEYGAECYCDNNLHNNAVSTAATDCNMLCSGSPDKCGGPNRLNLYWSGAPPPAIVVPTALANYGFWSHKGCYTDGGERTLPVGMAVAAPFTPQKCLANCQAQGYTYAGVEYATECWCGNEIGGTGVLAASTTCDMKCSGATQYLCGGGNRLNLYYYDPTAPTSTSASAAPTSTGPSELASYNNWASYGCYVDGNPRTLPNQVYPPAPLTVGKCIDTCAAAGYTVAGVEYAGECFCNNELPPEPANDGCDMLCNGDQNHFCGGPNRLNVYKIGAPTTTTTPVTTSTSASVVPTGPSVLASYSNWGSKGCYVDGNPRTLPNQVYPAAPMTVGKCVDTCAAAGYTVAGVEYSGECFCNDALPPQPANDGCDMLCSGDPNHFCGGANRLNVYQLGAAPPPPPTSTSVSSAAPTSTVPVVLQAYGNWQSQGCYTEAGGERTVLTGTGVTGPLTPQKCMDACYAGGYNYAGVEYSAECYCGLTLTGNGVPTNEGCDMLCDGNNLLYCGGGNRVNVYKYNGVVPPPQGPPPQGGAAPPPVTNLPAPWHYAGCWVDNAFGRILGFNGVGGVMNTIESCVTKCANVGYSLAGTEFGEECYCGNALANAAVRATNQNDCNVKCSGNDAEGCGGPNRISLYSTTTDITVYPVAKAKTTGLPNGFTYLGCYGEQPDTRVFPYYYESLTSMTVEGCIAQCAKFGFPAAGLQYAQECWCGDVDDIVAHDGFVAPATECALPCTGSPADTCGGVKKMNIYTSPPIAKFNTPENTGHYEFLIGGLVIPLITTLGINNKVTILEKGGTGVQNATGAYELDYTLSSDYTKAWREMHVKTDVFCAANLVLPDRKGRQLSVGGWSLESTEGVRLYTPSGSLGVNGTTDWEESVFELHLQLGRWYPGVMIMANGSILVVGGEDGSNGPPVPSLEILPKPEGGDTYLTMQWLVDTDPFNLYPFLYVLPGGGIFAIYYNEARILNEVTFETLKVLPTIPGAVNNKAGRTYPMAGVSMMLPQYAPYTTPVEVLTCGGSANGEALDNCVTIAPEVDGADWVVERMPSRRVMPLMAALPDGTYLVLGGAHKGTAGFGLGQDPNYTALLYDPTKPVNSRFSILASTIVARMYHSEATLLHDGRVMVSGSDPEDPIHPQEYRIEVYVPPYLCDGRIQPSYTIVNRDWTYGGQYLVQVALPQGTAATMRVSLMGSVSSTHGNSYGQRTIFPSFSCAGNTCTIIAPPNAHVCPPGWYQLFILDGPTPSHSQWVRIGGDPSNLGNWPNFPAFTLPGVGGI